MILRSLFWSAARRLAADEQTRAKAGAFVQDEVRPRAVEAARRAGRVYGEARADWAQQADKPAAYRAGRLLRNFSRRFGEDGEGR
ncbi:hypothetical protein [Algihabitans albus]|uniref:hypothetical protein n=1 Tax=Algihabitans albus TaxID=2164067 RepID=UPI000E5C9C32|nr:hypothetical protein [Algihabitans albus]